MTYGILIIGANGVGKTTLGAALADKLGFLRMDIEDYYFPTREEHFPTREEHFPTPDDCFPTRDGCSSIPENCSTSADDCLPTREGCHAKLPDCGTGDSPRRLPFDKPRTRDEVVALMEADVALGGGFVISAVNGDFVDSILSRCGLAVYVSAPPEVRARRIRQRALDRFGDRVREGGDMYESERRFFEMADARPTAPLEEFARSLPCPLLRVDGTLPPDENADIIAREYSKIYSMAE